MLNRFRALIASPVFPADEDKTRQARVLNIILLCIILFLFFYGVIAIPFLFAQKIFNELLILISLGIAVTAYLLMRHGRIQLASVILVTGMWLALTLFLSFAGGTTSAVVIYYLAGTMIAGLLLGTYYAITFAAACCLAGLGMTILAINGHALPRIFPVSPIAGWIDMTVILLSSVIILRLVLNNLEESLSLTRQRLEALQNTEAELLESEERFSRLSDLTFEGIGISDQGKVIDSNPQLSTMLGFAPEELIGKNANDFVAPESLDLVTTNERADSTGPYEHQAVRKDGSTFPVEIRARTIPFKGHQARVAIIRDITERKQTEKNLSQQIDRLRALHTIEQAVTSSMDLHTILELLVKEVVKELQVDATSVLLLNPQKQTLDFAAGQGFHTTALQFTSLKIGNGLAGRAAKERQIVHIANLAKLENNPILARSIVNEKFTTYFGVPLIAKEQVRGVMEIFNRSPLAPDPNWLRFLETLAGQAAISIDNARWLEMTMESLKETNALYRINKDMASTMDPAQLMENTVNLLQENFGYFYVQIFVIQRETGDFVFRAGSGDIGRQLKDQDYHLSAGEGIVGYTAETGKPFFTNDVDNVISYVRAPFLTGTKSELAVPIKAGNRILGLLDIHQSPPALLTELDVQMVTTVADQLAVSLQKAQLYSDLQNSLLQEQATRSQLIHAEKLATVGRLLASVSHELNNPLQAIQNALFLLRDETGISAQGRQDLKIVLSEAERMATLLERLRTTYQPAGVEDFLPVQMNDLINDVHALIATHLRHADISFEFLSDPDLPVIPGLGNQLKQVLLNLFMNAADAMPDGGSLTVSTQYLTDAREVLITIRDTGTGIEASILPNLFEAFTTSKENGTGLGLAISYEIVLKHHGRIQGENLPGGGARFSVWLPAEIGAL